MEKEEMIFKLSEEVEFSAKGEYSKTATIQIEAPSMEVFDEVSELSQMVMGSMIDASKNIPAGEKQEEPEDTTIDADAVKAMLMAARSVKLKDIRKCFDVVALECATFDGEVKITETTLKRLSIEDYTRMVCEYIANFIIPSLV